MAIQEAISNPEADTYLNDVPDGDSAIDEQESNLPPEPLNLTFSDDLWAHAPKLGDPRDYVQKQMCDGVWCTLCNICHQPVPISRENTSDDREDFAAHWTRPGCFEVKPCYAEVEQMPSHCGDVYFICDAEQWHKQKGKVFVVCAGCWVTLVAVVSQLPVSPTRPSGKIEEGDIRPDAVVVEDTSLGCYLNTSEQGLGSTTS
jgi:hypothetical protein